MGEGEGGCLHIVVCPIQFVGVWILNHLIKVQVIVTESVCTFDAKSPKGEQQCQEGRQWLPFS